MISCRNDNCYWPPTLSEWALTLNTDLAIVRTDLKVKTNINNFSKVALLFVAFILVYPIECGLFQIQCDFFQVECDFIQVNVGFSNWMRLFQSECLIFHNKKWLFQIESNIFQVNVGFSNWMLLFQCECLFFFKMNTAFSTWILTFISECILFILDVTFLKWMSIFYKRTRLFPNSKLLFSK